VAWQSGPAQCACVAAAAAEYFGTQSRYDVRLRELDFGTWEGIAWTDIPRSALDEWAADPFGFAPPAGESGAQLICRVRSFFFEVCSPRRATIVISHGGPLRILTALAQDTTINLLAPSPPPGSVQVLQT
jgi:alpha-ribazole phosphatase